MTSADHARLSARIDVLSERFDRLRDAIDILTRELRSQYDTKPDLHAERKR
jgi:hypothetical protein